GEPDATGGRQVLADGSRDRGRLCQVQSQTVNRVADSATLNSENTGKASTQGLGAGDRAHLAYGRDGTLHAALLSHGEVQDFASPTSILPGPPTAARPGNRRALSDRTPRRFSTMTATAI